MSRKLGSISGRLYVGTIMLYDNMRPVMDPNFDGRCDSREAVFLLGFCAQPFFKTVGF